MLGPSWIAMFGRLPVNYHDSLALTMATGAEIMVQSLLRLESDFVILRGRMAGSTDAARVIILPYDQITNVAFQKRMLEPEVEAIFGPAQEFVAVPVPGSPASAATSSTTASPNAETKTEAAPAESIPAAWEKPGQRKPVSQPATAAAPNGSPAAPPTNGEASKEKSKLPMPSKSLLLTRLRARLAEQGQ